MSKHFKDSVTQLDKLARHNRQGGFCPGGHRPYAQDAGSNCPMTSHGLCHTRAAEWYVEFTKQGQTPYQARRAVSKLMGHGRDNVARIYLASLDKEDVTDGK